MVVLDVSPRGRDRALKDGNGEVLRGGPAGHMIGDPFNPAFLKDLDDIAERQVKPRRDDPNLQMWFAGNEIGMFDKAQRGRSGVRDFRRWLWSDVPPGSTLDNPLCARHALGAYLRERAVDGQRLATRRRRGSFAMTRTRTSSASCTSGCCRSGSERSRPGCAPPTPTI